MKYGKIIFDEFNQWVYNDVNQAGDKLQIINASDLPEIIQNIVKFSLPDKDNYDYLRGFIDGEGLQEPKHKDDYPGEFNGINEMIDRMWELKGNEA